MKNVFKLFVLSTLLVLVLVVFTACYYETLFCVHQGGEATCSAFAICEKCGEEYGSKLEHTLEYYAEIPPTCTEEGLSGGSSCTVCKQEVRRRFVIPAKGHYMLEANCGYPSRCNRKGCTYTEGEPLQKDHKWKEYEGKLPTCTSGGYSDYHVCDVCGISENFEYFPPIAHDFTVEIEGCEPTCTQNGYTAHMRCKCGAVSERTVIYALGHSWDNVSCTEPSTCTTCGETKEPTNAHSYMFGVCIYCGHVSQENPNEGIEG